MANSDEVAHAAECVDIASEQTRDFLLDQLRCVVCQTVDPDSAQCYNCHTHCMSCMDGMCQQSILNRTLACSVCRTRKGWASTRICFDMAARLDIKVECGVEDCSVCVPVAELQDHRTRCTRRRFECPLQCECEPMRLAALIEHLQIHQRSVRSITSHECLNLIASSEETPRIAVLLFDGQIICIRLRIRMLRADGCTVELYSGGIGNPGQRTGVRVNAQLYDLCSNDFAKTTSELTTVESVAALRKTHSLFCYDNFIEEALDTHISVIDDQWTRKRFLSYCHSEVREQCELDSHRVVAIVLQLERVER